MKKTHNLITGAMFAAGMIAMTGFTSFAQSAIDAYNLSQNEIRGTARFMAMGGAFTALGGDLSTLTQNPAGIGIYRSSETGATLGIDFKNFKTTTPGLSQSDNKTRFLCNNFGYVGTIKLKSGMETFNWGVSYGRVKSFDNIVKGYNMPTNTSLTNYIAGFTNGTNPSDMEFEKGKYNPYLDSDADWLSILSYSAYMININPTSGNKYVGLYQNGTIGDAEYVSRQHGYVDEYSFNAGGNINNMFFWGVGIGVTDIDYRCETYYSESMENALVANANGNLVRGDAGFNLYNRKHIQGSGWNLKLGLLFKPVNEFRIGLAFHTPTWYNITQGYDGEVDYSYYDPNMANSDKNPMKGNDYTEWGSFDWKLRTPWRILTGVAGVIGNQAIVSLDYEYQAFSDMNVKKQSGPFFDSFSNAAGVNQDIKDYFRGNHIIRVGAEYRVTPQFSLRAGYNYTTSNVTDNAMDGKIQIYTSGTDPSFSLNKNTQAVSVGLGYRTGGWYIDGAFVYKKQDSKFQAYTNFDGLEAPYAKVTDATCSVVISAGYKF